MRAKIVQIGNSKGVRIPRNIIKELQFGDEAEMTVAKGSLIVSPIAKPRKGWSEAFLKVGKAETLIDDSIDIEAVDWEWQ